MCIFLATNSFPDPDGPLIKILLSVIEIFSIWSLILEIFLLSPIRSNDEKSLVLSYEKSKLSIDTIISEMKKQDIKIQDISTDDGDLEDVFLRLTKN